MGMFDELQKRMNKLAKDVEDSVSGKPKGGQGHTLGSSAYVNARVYAFDPCAAEPFFDFESRSEIRAGRGRWE